MKYNLIKCPRKELKDKKGRLWGIWDTQDNVWLGNEKGPNVYDSEILAQVAVQMVDVQLLYPINRLVKRVFNEKNLQYKDEVEIKVDALTALKHIEGGGL